MMLTEGLHEVPAGNVAAVVTYLEMTAPAMPTRALPAGMTATQERLDNDSFRRLFKEIGAPWLWTSRLTMSDDALQAILTDDVTEITVIRKDGDPIAFIELDFSDAGVCELAFFGMVQSATGQGLGGPMMALAQSRAFRAGIAKFTMHTCSLDDPRALTFYQKAGFTPVKRAVEIFVDPRIDGPHDAATAPQIPCII